MNYISTVLERPLSVSAIVSIHYFEYTPDFAYTGESHDFWELIVCDNGKLLIKADERELILNKGQAYLHPPMQYHNVSAYGGEAANSIVLSFESDTKELYCIADKLISVDKHTETSLSHILKESRECFSNDQGKVIDRRLIRRTESAPFAAEQVIGHYLELLLIHTIRQALDQPSLSPAQASAKRHDLANEVCAYMSGRITEKLTFTQIARHFSVSPTTLKKLFRDAYGHGVMEHLTYLRLDLSKELLRNGKHSCTEIAALCGFCSVHHYSNVFKKHENMSPTEYVRSVKAMLETVED